MLTPAAVLQWAKDNGGRELYTEHLVELQGEAPTKKFVAVAEIDLNKW